MLLHGLNKVLPNSVLVMEMDSTWRLCHGKRTESLPSDLGWLLGKGQGKDSHLQLLSGDVWV